MPGTARNTEALREEALREIGSALATFDPLRFRVWSDLGLTTAQLRVLFDIRQSPGVTAGELATQLSVTPPTISGIVDRLVRFELVERREDPADRRLVRNVLTEAGERCCSRLEEAAGVYVRRILSEMKDNDIRKLVDGLRALREASEFVLRVEPDIVNTAMPPLDLS